MTELESAASDRSKSGKKRKPKNRRRRSREFALQGIYQWRLAGGDTHDIDTQLRETGNFGRADGDYFSSLLSDVLTHATTLEEQVQPFLDRPLTELSPVEYAILLLGSCELTYHPEIPYRVIINEAIELAKNYGGTDGHKYINGVMDKLASRLRPIEFEQKIPRKNP